MAITYFGSASNPADNSGKDALSATAVTPPASMVAGDLVVMVSTARSASAITHTLSVDGGQSWTSESVFGEQAPAQSLRLFWCQFDGTWDADPAVDASGTSAHSVVMHVFRPTSGSNTWATDQAQSPAAYTAPSTPFTVTITGQTPANASSVGLAVWTSQDDNTWGSLSGTGWSVVATAQFRNTQAASNQSQAAAYNIKTTAATQNNVSLNQATLGGDAGLTMIQTWYEAAGAPPPSTTQFLMLTGCGT